ncbi:hypothetical protein C5167_041187 [Papaver somniferum]|uniref:Uncharacterized protein n=1 Tax=Papaver somniferum TaxID=3469 RepID=A0A4Y7IH67_PAPSO|nr:hypothetical protein C5167_041187 [Papaver somniferum]
METSTETQGALAAEICISIENQSADKFSVCFCPQTGTVNLRMDHAGTTTDMLDNELSVPVVYL